MEMENLILKQPKLDDSAKHSVLINKYFQRKSNDIDVFIEQINNPKYLFWDKARFYKAPTGYTIEEAWLTARIIRKIGSVRSPVLDQNGETYTYIRAGHFDKLLHHIDLGIGGKFLVHASTNDERQRYLSRGIIEEAIASSQLEGANTSRQYAKKMIAERIKPRNTSEKMILNNYHTMNYIETDLKKQDLSIDLLCEIHRELTMDTLEDPEDVGRVRAHGDGINVIYEEKIAHRGAERAFLDEQLPKLVAYANDDTEFIHPIIKASILHFWIGYLHPFADGNGRLARTIFYWYLFKHEYWGVAFLPISMVIKRARAQYAYSYLYAEQGGKDITYFIDFSIRKLMVAMNEFNDYIETLLVENDSIDRHLKEYPPLNERQKQVLYYVSKDTSHYTTETSHRTLNDIAKGTSRTDLHKLRDLGLLHPVREGKMIKYFASTKLQDTIRK